LPVFGGISGSTKTTLNILFCHSERSRGISYYFCYPESRIRKAGAKEFNQEATKLSNPASFPEFLDS
jgi:hypothetical protein